MDVRTHMDLTVQLQECPLSEWVGLGCMQQYHWSSEWVTVQAELSNLGKKINRNLLCMCCVNCTNFYTHDSTDTKFLFEVTIFYTRKWTCDKANGVCGIKLVHFSCSFITPVKWCPAVQCFIILQVVIVRHPVANSSTVLVAMPWWLWAAVCCHVQNPWMETNPLIASQSFIFFRILITSMWQCSLIVKTMIGTVTYSLCVRLSTDTGGGACGQQEIWHHVPALEGI